MGALYADLIAYLVSWVALFKDVDKAQLSLFEDLQLNETQRQKNNVVKDLLAQVFQARKGELLLFIAFTHHDD